MNDIKILGDSNRKSRFNPHLADRVNKEAEKYKAPRRVISPSNPVKSERLSDIFSMDDTSARSRALIDYGAWVNYWCGISDGRLMASMADYYAVFKNIKSIMENGSSEQKAKAELLWSSIKSDLDETIITSTTVKYNPTATSAMIYHYDYFDKTIIKPRAANFLEANCMPIREFLDNSQSRIFMQACLNTNDNKDVIAETLEYITGITDIRIWLESHNFADKSNNIHPMHMCYDFLINPDSDVRFEISFDITTTGYSRGVRHSRVNK